jgi:hypothetical protein
MFNTVKSKDYNQQNQFIKLKYSSSNYEDIATIYSSYYVASELIKVSKCLDAAIIKYITRVFEYE